MLMKGWNRIHEKDSDIQPPTPKEWEKAQERIYANPHLTREVVSDIDEG